MPSSDRGGEAGKASKKVEKAGFGLCSITVEAPSSVPQLMSLYPVKMHFTKHTVILLTECSLSKLET